MIYGSLLKTTLLREGVPNSFGSGATEQRITASEHIKNNNSKLFSLLYYKNIFIK